MPSKTDPAVRGGLIIALVVGGFAVLKANGPGVVLWLIAAVFWAIAVVLLATLGRDWWRGRGHGPEHPPPNDPPPSQPRPPTTGIRARNVRGLKSSGNIFIGVDQAWDVEDVEDWEQGDDTIIGPNPPKER